MISVRPGAEREFMASLWDLGVQGMGELKA